MNNAGMQHRAPLEDFPAERFEQLLQTNVPQPAAALRHNPCAVRMWTL